MYTRQEYLDGLVSHQAYYGQFVDEHLRKTIADNFGVEWLQEAYRLEKYFNRIPLYEWDAYYPLFTQLGGLPKLVKQAGDSWSLSTCVCIVKEAARMVVLAAAGGVQ